MIGAALKDIVDSCVNIDAAAGKDDDVYANIFDILTCVMAITDNLQSSDRSDTAYDEAAKLLDKIVAAREEE
jgi:hypothetical protein